MTTDNTHSTQAEQPQALQTPLHHQHLAMGAKMVDFGQWRLPVNYTSQVAEHHAVRNDAGMFDVSHMTVSDITGPDTIAFLSVLLANDIHKITAQPGKALYTCMLNDNGGIIDDLIVYHLNHEHCRLVTNAATNIKDMAWINHQASRFDTVVCERPELALIAVQGPNAIKKAQQALPETAQTITKLKRFQGAFSDDIFIGRTGYTGEDGIEIILPATQAAHAWEALACAGVQPCGLGARDTLRLEAGMALYGSDLDEQHTPFDCGLGWSVSLSDTRDFIGKDALQKPADYRMIGLQLDGKGVLRGHQRIIVNNESVGEITSGTFSPSLECSIALARVHSSCTLAVDDNVHVEIRQRQIPAHVVKYPFWRAKK